MPGARGLRTGEQLCPDGAGPELSWNPHSAQLSRQVSTASVHLGHPRVDMTHVIHSWNVRKAWFCEGLVVSVSPLHLATLRLDLQRVPHCVPTPSNAGQQGQGSTASVDAILECVPLPREDAQYWLVFSVLNRKRRALPCAGSAVNMILLTVFVPTAELGRGSSGPHSGPFPGPVSTSVPRPQDRMMACQSLILQGCFSFFL